MIEAIGSDVVDPIVNSAARLGTGEAQQSPPGALPLVRKGIVLSRNLGLLGAVAVFAAVLSACGNSEGSSDATAGQPEGATPVESSASGDDVWADQVAAAEAGETIGGADSACPMPVTFALGQGWTPTEITEEDTRDEIGQAAYVRGDFRQICQIDGPLGGQLDQLLVWAADTALPATEATLRSFLDATPSQDPVRDQQFREITVDGRSSAEMTTLTYSDLIESERRKRGFVVSTDEATVIVRLSGFDVADHNQLVPGYVLAKETLRPTD